MYIIESLSKSNLKSALQLRNTIFQDLSKCDKETLEASLDINNEKYKNCLSKNQISYLEYFVMQEPKTRQVIGLTGLYVENDNNECWLGWFCVDENYRNNGLGQKLLDFSISRAKELKKKILKLYTYNSEEYKSAIKLYETNYFVEIAREKKDIYYQLELTQTITKHRYIKKYPIKKDDKHLILGTIHPHSTSELDFFYGNAKTFWDLLAQALGLQFDNLDNILDFLKKHNIAISDMILQCCRQNETATKDSELYNLVLNKNIKKKILYSNIETIYFTSAFGKNNAARLFFDLFDLKEQIPENWRETNEFNIMIDNKEIKCIVLLSPSGASNIGISKSKMYQKVKNKYDKIYDKPIKQFKIDFYKAKFKEVTNANKTE
jgi:ribosomal protein S18 acetylase RimI-like enzyme